MTICGGKVRCPAPVGDQLWERALNSASSRLSILETTWAPRKVEAYGRIELKQGVVGEGNGSWQVGKWPLR